VVSSLIFVLSLGDWSIHHPAHSDTDKRQYLLVLGADNGRLYWKTPLDLISVAIGEA
jgi:hypothetical protein